jgi:hypothetical protein
MNVASERDLIAVAWVAPESSCDAVTFVDTRGAR